MVPVHARACQELEVSSPEEPSTAVGSAPHLAPWVPGPDEVHEPLGLQRELQRLLDPLDYRIAELLMEHRLVQGDKHELARLLSASEGYPIAPSRVTRAIQAIRAALDQVRSRRSVYRR